LFFSVRIIVTLKRLSWFLCTLNLTQNASVLATPFSYTTNVCKSGQLLATPYLYFLSSLVSLFEFLNEEKLSLLKLVESDSNKRKP